MSESESEKSHGVFGARGIGAPYSTSSDLAHRRRRRGHAGRACRLPRRPRARPLPRAARPWRPPPVTKKARKALIAPAATTEPYPRDTTSPQPLLRGSGGYPQSTVSHKLRPSEPTK